MIESDQQHFVGDVIDASCERTVIVDFWAPWCGPCRALGPLLERLEQAYDGRFALVKIDSDRNPELAAQFRVRSIPSVLAFVDGSPVDGFVGALTEAPLRAFLDRVVPDAAESERRKAQGLAEAGRLDDALTALRAAVALDPARSRALLDLAQLLLDRLPPPVDAGRQDEAARALQAVPKADRDDARWRALDTRLASLRSAASAPGAEALERQVAAQPANLAARLELARLHIAERRFDHALAELMEIVERDRKFEDDVGRKTMLSVFELAADQRELVASYRRRLAAVLNR